jgi:hypothetical protein
MSNVVQFPPSLLDQFLGEWIRDPLSVSRNKVVKRALGSENLKRLWDCGSMAEIHQVLQSDEDLASKYEALCRASEARLAVTRRNLTWVETGTAFVQPRSRSSLITRVSAEGRKIIVHSTGSPTVRAYVLRMKKEWLLASQLFSGRNALYFPPSPVFRYYRPIDMSAAAAREQQLLQTTGRRPN